MAELEERGRGGRRRVGAMLNTYYHIEGAKQEEEDASREQSAAANRQQPDDLDRQGFDAKRYFDKMTAIGQLPDLVQRSKSLDVEVRDLDADMQMLVYENYSKFIRATDVIKQMRFTIDGLAPDLRNLDKNLKQMGEYQAKVENCVSSRQQQMDGLMRQQRLCRKLRLLFALPRTLQSCLDRGAYGTAVEAYCNCAGFLRQYENMATFQKVLGEVDAQMGRIRSALESRLRSPDISVDEAVNSSLTLLDLREDHKKVVKEFLDGRSLMLQRCLDQCFDTLVDGSNGASYSDSVAMSREEKELQRPESVALRGICNRLIELYVPTLCDAVEGFSKLQTRLDACDPVGNSIDSTLVADFVSSRVEEVCTRLFAVVENKSSCPPTRVLVSCVHSLRDALLRLHTLYPRLLTKHFVSFLTRTATTALKLLFASSSSSVVVDLRGLHDACKRLQESKTSVLDDVLDEIATTEQSLIMHGFTALTDCTPLLTLLGGDREACQDFVRGVRLNLMGFFLAFVEACHAYLGTASGSSPRDPSLPPLAPEAAAALEGVADLPWNGLFGLALVRIGRHLEVKALSKVWQVARDLFAGAVGGDAHLSTQLGDVLSTPPLALVRATRAAAQAAMTQYAIASGQRLAHFFRNSIQSRNWLTVRQPREPRLVVEMVLKEVHAFDAQLARILGDPRKPHGQETRRMLNQGRSAMELEMERLFAKKMPVFTTIPFNRNGAIAGILRIAFKALYEYMREETFAKFGLQQIQVDCAFLAEFVREFVEAEDAHVLDSLLAEALACATARCSEPVLMDALLIESLCDEKKKTFKLE